MLNNNDNNNSSFGMDYASASNLGSVGQAYIHPSFAFGKKGRGGATTTTSPSFAFGKPQNFQASIAAYLANKYYTDFKNNKSVPKSFADAIQEIQKTQTDHKKIVRRLTQEFIKKSLLNKIYDNFLEDKIFQFYHAYHYWGNRENENVFNIEIYFQDPPLDVTMQDIPLMTNCDIRILIDHYYTKRFEEQWDPFKRNLFLSLIYQNHLTYTRGMRALQANGDYQRRFGTVEAILNEPTPQATTTTNDNHRAERQAMLNEIAEVMRILDPDYEAETIAQRGEEMINNNNNDYILPGLD